MSTYVVRQPSVSLSDIHDPVVFWMDKEPTAAEKNWIYLIEAERKTSDVDFPSARRAHSVLDASLAKARLAMRIAVTIAALLGFTGVIAPILTSLPLSDQSSDTIEFLVVGSFAILAAMGALILSITGLYRSTRDHINATKAAEGCEYIGSRILRSVIGWDTYAYLMATHPENIAKALREYAECTRLHDRFHDEDMRAEVLRMRTSVIELDALSAVNICRQRKCHPHATPALATP